MQRLALFPFVHFRRVVVVRLIIRIRLTQPLVRAGYAGIRRVVGEP